MKFSPSIPRFFRCVASIAISLTLLTALTPPTDASAASILYVQPTATGAEDCSAWADACTLQTALTNAVSGDEIWVMAGTHYPTSGADRTTTFQLQPGVGVYGGFAGTEALRGDRDATTNVTTLSGDIGTPGDNSDNVYHVVTGSGTNSTAILDGFTITGGKADGGGYDNMGGGMFNSSGSPTLTNIVFTGNAAANGGGGMYNTDSSPTLTDATFTLNAANWGGGMRNDSSSNATLARVTFSANIANFGGGAIYNASSSPTFTNVTFSGNTALQGGAILLVTAGNPVFTNVTFSDNHDNDGIAIWSQIDFTAYNTIFVKSTAGLNCYGGQLTVASANNLADDSACGSGATESSSINLGALGNYGGSTQTVRLRSNSSAIDAGNPSYCPAADQRGVSRLQGAQCDIGAYEHVNQAPTAVALDDNSVAENAPVGTLVGNLSATDADADDSHAYSLACTTPGADDGSFQISGSQLQTNAVFDYETKNSYSVCIRADDGRDGAFDQALTVNVTDGIDLLTANFLSISAEDGWVLESTETSSVGGSLDNNATVFRLGDDIANKQYRAILSFNTSSLPDTAVITKVTLKIRRYGTAVGTDPFSTLGALWVDIRKPYFGSSAALANNDFQAAAGKNSIGNIPNTPVNNWYTKVWSTDTFFSFINRTGATQFRLRFATDDNNNNIADYLVFFSGDYATIDPRPTLIIEYYVP